ncbi:MAG TPA: acyl carrier protein [Longimicrobium sp.]|nr:acyl carrier protein [Longimicrobium sp.]
MSTETIQSPDRLSRIAARVTDLLARMLGMEAAELDPASSFLELGADSLLLMQLSRGVETSFGVRVPFRRLLEGLSSIGELAAHLEREVPPEADPAPAPPATSDVPAAANQSAPPAPPAVRDRASIRRGPSVR